jgi:hypothetical protein
MSQQRIKTDEVKDSFYKELEHMFYKFPKYHMKVFLEDFNVNFAAPENLALKIIMFPQHNT